MARTYNTNVAEIQKAVQERQALEIQLAWDLLETFNTTPEFIETLRAMARDALAEILTLSAMARKKGGEHQKKINDAIEKTIADEVKIGMGLLTAKTIPVDKPGLTAAKKVAKVDDLAKILNDYGKLDAQECSDVVRLYGGIVEELGKAGEQKYKELHALKDSYRKEIIEGKADAIWNQLKDQKLYGRHRERVPQQYQDAMAKLMGAAEKSKQAQALDPNDKTKGAMPDGMNMQEFLISFGGGQSQMVLKDTSTVNKMDRVFGFVPAADISGTTTDTLFFMQRFSRTLTSGLDPAFYLLPCATIVAGAHHSLLEVALSLSINNLVDYKLGFYSTLYPKRTGTEHKGHQEIKKALDEAEKRAKAPAGGGANHHIVIAYKKDKEIEGAWTFQPTEKAYRDFVSAKALLTPFTALPAWPKKADLEKLLGTKSLL